MTNDFDITSARADLIALRVKHGADTPIGHRISNLLNQLEALEQATDPGHRQALQKLIGQSLTELADLQ